ncbi:hypothetical protein D9M68_123080 [compost metagenome]
MAKTSMKVKANWPVDTGNKVRQAGEEFDLDKDEAEHLERLGAVEILGRKKGADKAGETDPGAGKTGEPQS